MLTGLIWKVTTCGMSETIGPVHIKERPGSEMQSRIDAEVSLRTQNYITWISH